MPERQGPEDREAVRCTDFYVHTSKSLSGPWSEPVQLPVTPTVMNSSWNDWNWQGNDPSMPAPFMFPNGTTLVYYQGKTCPAGWGNAARVGVMRAADWRGPYEVCKLYAKFWPACIFWATYHSLSCSSTLERCPSCTPSLRTLSCSKQEGGSTCSRTSTRTTAAAHLACRVEAMRSVRIPLAIPTPQELFLGPRKYFRL